MRKCQKNISLELADFQGMQTSIYQLREEISKLKGSKLEFPGFTTEIKSSIPEVKIILGPTVLTTCPCCENKRKEYEPKPRYTIKNISIASYLTTSAVMQEIKKFKQRKPDEILIQTQRKEKDL